MLTNPPHSNTLKGKDLQAKTRVLLDSPYFTGVTDNYPFSEKRLIYLVLAGLKPVAEVQSGHWEVRPGGRETVPDDPAKVGKLLDALGLAYNLASSKHATLAVVASTPELVEAYLQATELGEIGRLLGYPETAVVAFCAGEDELLPPEEFAKALDSAGLQSPEVSFRLSRRHWKEELEQSKQWYAALQEVGLA